MKPKQQEGLFDHDPVMKCRDSKGRFATPERAYADKAIKENNYLRLEREKYMRAWIAASDMASYWQRKYLALQAKIKSIQ